MQRTALKFYMIKTYYMMAIIHSYFCGYTRPTYCTTGLGSMSGDVEIVQVNIPAPHSIIPLWEFTLTSHF